MIEQGGGTSVAQQYFEHLCRTEDSETIVKRAEDVDGFLLMRPRGDTEGSPDDSDRYAPEEPIGFGWFTDQDQLVHWPLDRLGSAYVQPLYGVYRYVEYVQPGVPSKIIRVARSAQGDVDRYPNGIDTGWRSFGGDAIRVPYLVERTDADRIGSRYAYTWRGLRRSRDREFGVAGGEFFLKDRQTNEVLAMKRTFNSTFVPGKSGVTRWSAARDCRSSRQSPPIPKFIIKVLVPDIHVNDTFVPPSVLDEYHQSLKRDIEKSYAH